MQPFRLRRIIANEAEGIDAAVPSKTRNCATDGKYSSRFPSESGKRVSHGRNHHIGSVQDKKMRIRRKEPAHRFRARQENENQTEGIIT